MPQNRYPYELMPLPYSDDALEPYINTETLRIHHNRLLKGYVDKLNNTLKDMPRLHALSLEQLLKAPLTLPAGVRTSVVNFGGGVYNHNFFFHTLQPGTPVNRPVGRLADALNSVFGSFDAFKAQFREKAMAVFGSGWLWLVRTPQGKLHIMPTDNQNTPLSQGFRPIMVIDVWEHAYFLQYLNLRGEYIDNFWNVVNWEQADLNSRA